MKTIRTIIAVSFIVTAIITIGAIVTISTSTIQAIAQQEEEIVFIAQKTAMSTPAPIAATGQTPHQVVFALPIREDDKIWSGRVTFTASKPIEIEVLHTYDPSAIPDAEHGEPYNAVLPGNKSIAISQMAKFIDTPLIINDTSISSGSLEFAGTALVFHKTSGEPFTVTYTIDAVAKALNQ